MKQMKTLKNAFHYIFAPAAYKKGLKHYSDKQWQHALSFFEQAAAKKPGHPHSSFKLGLCHMKLGNLEEAHYYIQAALKLAPYNAQWREQLAQSERKLSNANLSPLSAASVDLKSLPPRTLQGGTNRTVGVSIRKKLLLIPSDYNHRAMGDILPFVAHYADEFDVYIIIRDALNDVEKKQGYTLVKNGTSYGEFLKFTAEYVLDAGCLNLGYRVTDAVEWVSVWHGIPYKKMFVDLDIKHLPSAINYGLAYDSMVSMSDFYTETFLRGAMRYDGKIHQLGCAKVDKLVSSHQENTQDLLVRTKKALGIPLEHKVILYAPEFRNQGGVDLPFDPKKILDKLGSEYRMLVWLNSGNSLSEKINHENVIVTNELSALQASLVGDLLISDYRCALIQAFRQTGRPVVLFQYDYGSFCAENPERREELEQLALQPYSFTRAHQLDTVDWPALMQRDNTASQDQTVSALLKQVLGIQNDKKVILYAPTYRERGDVVLPFDPEKLAGCLNDEYVIIAKLHYLNRLKDKYKNVIDCTEYGEIADLMKISDILISDYSSLILDFALLNKPIVLFQYDYFNYMQERGVYFNFEDYLPANQIVDREIDLYRLDWQNLSGDNRKLIETFYPLEDGNSTRRIVDALGFDGTPRQTKDIIFLVNDLNQIGGIHVFVHNMAKYYKQHYNSRIYLIAVKEFAASNDEFHIFDSPYVDFKMSSQYLAGGCANILQNTDGVVISLQFSAHLHFQKYLYNAKSVLMFHGDAKDMISGELYKPHLGWLNEGVLFNYQKLLLLTQANIDLLAPHVNEEVRGRLGYIHNSIDAAYTPLPESDQKAVAFISRLDADKNIFALIDLGRELQRAGSDYVVNIYGDGEYKSALQEQIDANGLAGILTIRGFEQDKAKIFAENNALIMLSKSEGFGLVVLEAYAYGRPVVAMNSFTPAPEVIHHGKTGYLAETDNFAQMVEYIHQIDRLDEKLIEALFNQFSNGAIFAIWDKLFQELDSIEH